uniref:hypothetical protein n=1 Tax=Yoonia sp. TaxID=2212373 RepID=UPI004048197C
CSFTVPPEMKINKNKKMVAYGNQHIDFQLRFLRNKINYLIHDLEIKNYITVFEITKMGIVHCHTVFDFDKHQQVIRVTYANIMCFKKYQQQLNNCVIKEDNITDTLAEYLCKIIYEGECNEPPEPCYTLGGVKHNKK